jgi:membrane protein involved in colicin uptake
MKLLWEEQVNQLKDAFKKICLRRILIARKGNTPFEKSDCKVRETKRRRLKGGMRSLRYNYRRAAAARAAAASAAAASAAAASAAADAIKSAAARAAAARAATVPHPLGPLPLNHAAPHPFRAAAP